MSKITQMWKEQNGVSPVIGVVLLVAITVILAAVVGVLAFGLDNNQNASPSVAMESSAQGQTVEFTVSSGDNFDPSTATLKIDVTVKNPKSGNSKTTSLSSALDNDTSKSLTITDASGNDENVDVEFASLDSDDVTAGDSFSVNLASSKSNSNLAIVNYNAKVVRQSDGGSSSSVLFSDKGSASASSSSSGSTSKFDITAQYESLASANDRKYTVTYDFNDGYTLNASEHQVKATFDVVNTTTGDVSTRVIAHDEGNPDDNMTVMLTNDSYTCPNTYSLECEEGYYFGTDDGTLTSGDSFNFEITFMPPEREVESYTVKIIEISSGDEVYKDSGTP